MWLWNLFLNLFIFLVFTSHKQHLNMQHEVTIAATDIVLGTRHNNRADKNTASQVYPGTACGDNRGDLTVRVQDNMDLGGRVFTARGKGSNPTIKWNPVCVCVCVCVKAIVSRATPSPSVQTTAGWLCCGEIFQKSPTKKWCLKVSHGPLLSVVPSQ